MNSKGESVSKVAFFIRTEHLNCCESHPVPESLSKSLISPGVILGAVIYSQLHTECKQVGINTSCLYDKGSSDGKVLEFTYGKYREKKSRREVNERLIHHHLSSIGA